MNIRQTLDFNRFIEQWTNEEYKDGKENQGSITLKVIEISDDDKNVQCAKKNLNEFVEKFGFLEKTSFTTDYEKLVSFIKSYDFENEFNSLIGSLSDPTYNSLTQSDYEKLIDTYRIELNKLNSEYKNTLSNHNAMKIAIVSNLKNIAEKVYNNFDIIFDKHLNSFLWDYDKEEFSHIISYSRMIECEKILLYYKTKLGILKLCSDVDFLYRVLKEFFAFKNFYIYNRDEFISIIEKSDMYKNEKEIEEKIRVIIASLNKEE